MSVCRLTLFTPTSVRRSIKFRRLSDFVVVGDLLRWCEYYMSDRVQFVYVDGCRLDKLMCPSGVPQGFLLGPLFFSINIEKHCQ